MRALISSILFVIPLMGIATSQRMRFQNFNGPRQVLPSPLNSGGVGSSAQINSPTPVGPFGCFCLPSNQLCQPNGAVPVGATRITNIQTKIVNENPLANCPEGQNECCYGGPIPSSPPINQAISGCGARRSIKPGNVAAAEADFGEYPWVAAVTGPRNKFMAAGALISPSFVLTVAHKITNPRNLVVRLGDYNLAVPNEVPQFPHQEIIVDRVIIHPNFNATNLKNDVALLHLQFPAKLDNHINTVCLPEMFQIFSGQRCYVAGWGENLQSGFQPILKEVDLPIIDGFQCEESLRRTRLGSSFSLDQDSFLCAGGEAGKDACRGDGGAPLVCDENGKFTIAGMVAWGIGCGQTEVPGIYVNVAAFSNFINSNIF